MNLTPEEREVGRENYYRAVTAHDKITRRGFLAHVAAAGVVSTAGLGGMYFGYGKPANPVRIGIIGTGDEGGILIGALNPDYVQVKAICDIRPSSIHRALYGDYGGGNPLRTHSLRPGLMEKYDWKTESTALEHMDVYGGKLDDSQRKRGFKEGGYEELLKDKSIEAVIVALPLHLHAKASVDAMQAGKHVLTEKLMAHNIAQCKVMSRVSAVTSKYLATGHQRHYSVLYDNAVNIIRWGLLGRIHHIRAQWHRGNLPGRDSWAPPVPGGSVSWTNGDNIDKIANDIKSFEKQLARLSADSNDAVILQKKLAQWREWDADKRLKDYVEDYDYQRMQIGDYDRSALEELIRWRLWDRTGGGLMAELGSHQIDASHIFINALKDHSVETSKEADHPPVLSVHAVGGRHIFKQDRDAEDHVYATFEFPGAGYDAKFDVGYKDVITGAGSEAIPAYAEDDNNKVVVTYSSINGNSFGGYGEVVMGSKGTLVLEREEEVLLYKGSATTTKVGVKGNKGGAVLDTQESGPAGPAKATADAGPVSRGYAEEIEHWAWCIREDPNNRQNEVRPRCHPEVALADAVIALTAKVAVRNGNKGKGGFIKFEKEWFDVNHDATPDGSKYDEQKNALAAKI
ncbi:MAG: Gfo/Idh/MocA family oxidoreductase [Planctomycetes bacterium]|nr:Gfo/Idh/MocA family oxidoreductase [Planctomycetota bacterium]